MSGYNELDDILISLRQRRENEQNAQNPVPDTEKKAKSRVQRAAEEEERRRVEQEKLRQKREAERKAREEKERKERELREKELRERLERERKAREQAELERQRKKEQERAQLELQHAQWRAAQAKLKEEQEKEKQKLLEEEKKKQKLQEKTAAEENEKLKKEPVEKPLEKPKTNENKSEVESENEAENKTSPSADNSLKEILNNEENCAQNSDELPPPPLDKKAAKNAAKRAKLEAELLARRKKAEEKQRKKEEKQKLKLQKKQEIVPPKTADDLTDKDGVAPVENLPDFDDNAEKNEIPKNEVSAKKTEILSVDESDGLDEKPETQTENRVDGSDDNAQSEEIEQSEEFVWYKSVEEKKPKKSIKNIKEKFTPEKIKNGIKKGANAVFVKPFVFVKEMFRDEIFPAAGRSFKKMLTKQFAIFLAVVVVIGAAGYGGYRLYEYSRVAYLNSYKKEYPGIEFPDGILEEMCDDYGKNQNVVCKISPIGKDDFIVATSDKEDNYAQAYPQFDVKNEQQFQSIDVSNVGGFDNLESLYSTRDGFLDSAQMYDMVTLYSKSTYRVIAAFYTNTVATDDAGYVFPYNCYGNMTEKSFNAYVDKIKSRRLYDTGYNFSYNDRFLTLSVDSDFMPNFKFVVLCVKNTQKNTEKSTTAIDNETVHYPQVWYDKNGETNPYRFSSNWYPEIYTDANSGTKRLTNKDFQ